MDSISQVIHDCETCAAIKQAKRMKPLWYGGRWSKYKYGEAWQIDYITLPQTRQGKRYVLTMVEATTGWLETYPVPHATARNTILGLEKQVLWRHGTPERIESDNGTHFKNSLINNWAREHGIEWGYHIPYHAPASGKIERYNGLLKTTLKALGGGSFKNWEQHLAKATWLVNTRGSTNRAGPAQSESLHTVDGEKVPVVHVRGLLGKTVWINSASSTEDPIRGIVFAQGPGCTCTVKDVEPENQDEEPGNKLLASQQSVNSEWRTTFLAISDSNDEHSGENTPNSLYYGRNHILLYKLELAKKGSTLAGTSVLSPFLHIGSVIALAAMIYKKSTVQLFERHLCLYILTFVFVSAKITNQLVIAHMAKS
ncbi:hypothetical protein DUI87_34126 [Hirundo rustica rustica]|uniref:Integrase catalytic domain-containing protein n=1 Tax=Hirundo rustica rustica TaxID=333673 RepID=A0A3M0IM33_HIRRU|nr:hypothetical protein DUI87_34126 [Hirundo rustica rustica]